MSWQDKIRNPSCTLCPLHKTAEHVCLMGTGSKKARLMIVGEAPGAREDEQHAAFVGPAGQLLDKLLADVGIKREDCYITNAVKCRPPENATPSKGEAKACSTYLASEITKVEPSIILGLGNTALQALTGRSGITKHRGKTVSLGSTDVFCTFHPAAAMRSSRYLPAIRADFAAVARHLDGSDGPGFVKKTRTRVITNIGQVNALRRVLEQATTIAFDLETTGLHEWEGGAAIVTLGVSWAPGHAVVVPVWHSSTRDQTNWAAYVLRELKPVLEDPSKKYIAHNGKFDCKWLAKFGIYVPLTFDTMIAAHLLDENRMKGLKPLSELLLQADDYGIEVRGAYDIPLNKLAIYNGKDCDYTFQLYNIFRAQLKEQPRLLRLFKYLMMPASDLFTRIELGGIYVDPDRLTTRRVEAEVKVKKIERYMDQFLPKDMPSINYNSPAQVGLWLFNHLKLPIVEETKTGAPSTKESVLLKLSKEHKAVRALLLYRKWSKFLSTYLLPWSARVDRTSRLHPSFRLTGTVTGRLSSSEPNLQQVPRDSFIRGIVGSSPGWTFVEADYSQIELRLAAMLAQEPTMMRLLHEGKDLHTNTAQEITGKQDISKDERVIWGKHPNFGLLFSMKPEKYRDYCANNGIYISDKQAQDTYNKFHATYPFLRMWHKRMIRVAHAQGYVTTAMGRVRHLPDIRSSHKPAVAEAERQAINSVVQGLATDICLSSAIRLHKELNPSVARIVGSVHDALLFEVKDGAEQLAAQEIKTYMEDMTFIRKRFGADIDIPIVVDVEIGKHWSEGTSFDV